LQIFLLQDGEKTGPFTVYEVASHVREGKADAETLGWYQGADGWLPLQELPALETVFKEAEEQPDSSERVVVAKVEESREVLAPRQLQSSTRFWARVTDISLVDSAILLTALYSGILQPGHIIDPTEPNFTILLLPPVVLMFLEAISLHLFGTTPGKLLLRVKVKKIGGGRIPLRTAIKRSFTVWWRGIGLWIPGISLIAMIIAQTVFLKNGSTPWDEACELDVEYGKVDRWRVIVAIVAIFGMFFLPRLIFGDYPKAG